jgi:hypothetical protein
LALRERVFGREHPLSAESRLKTAEADFSLGRVDQALSAAQQARHDALDHIRFTVRYLPERRALAYASRLASSVSLELSLALAKPSGPVSPFLDAVIQSRSLVLDEIGARAHVVSDQQADLLPAQARLNATRQRYANLMLRSMSGTSAPSDVAAQLSAARREREDAEQALAERSAGVSGPDGACRRWRRRGPNQPARGPRSCRSCATTAPSRRPPPPFPVPAHDASASNPSYLAFVLKSGEADPILVPLGPGRHDRPPGGRLAAADDARRRRACATRPDACADGSRPRAGGRSSGIRCLAPRRRPPRIRRPRWALNLVPLDALPGTGDEYLVERPLVIHYVSAERDLAREVRPSPASEGLLAIGGPAFSDTSPFAAFRVAGARRPPPRPTRSSRGSSRIEPRPRGLVPCALSAVGAFRCTPRIEDGGRENRPAVGPGRGWNRLQRRRWHGCLPARRPRSAR